MPIINKIQLPNGGLYNIKDAHGFNLILSENEPTVAPIGTFWAWSREYKYEQNGSVVRILDAPYEQNGGTVRIV